MALHLPVAAQTTLIAFLNVRQGPVDSQDAFVNETGLVPVAARLVLLGLLAKNGALDGVDARPHFQGNEEESRQEKRNACPNAHASMHERTSLKNAGETIPHYKKLRV